MKKFLLLILLIAVAAFLQYKYDFLKLDKSAELQIERTANVVEQVKKINEFTSANFFDEKVARFQRTDKGFLWDSNNELVLIVRGKVRAGFDLSEMSDSDIVVSGDTLKVKLPQAKILDVILNPSDYDVFVETGNWDFNTMNDSIIAIKEAIRQDAIKDDILAKADKFGKDELGSLFGTMGFKPVIFE